MKYVSELEEKGEILVIRPTRHVDIGRMEKSVEKLEEMYNQGRTDAQSRLEEVISFISPQED